MFSCGFRRGTIGPHNGKGAGFGISTGIGVLNTPNTSNFIQQRICRYATLIRAGALYLSLKNDRYLITQRPHWHGCTVKGDHCKCNRYSQHLEDLATISSKISTSSAYRIDEPEVQVKLCLKAEEIDLTELSMNRLSAKQENKPSVKDDFLILYLDRSKLPRSKDELPLLEINLANISSPSDPLAAKDLTDEVNLFLSSLETSKEQVHKSEIPLEILPLAGCNVFNNEDTDHESEIVVAERILRQFDDNLDSVSIETSVINESLESTEKAKYSDQIDVKQEQFVEKESYDNEKVVLVDSESSDLPLVTTLPEVATEFDVDTQAPVEEMGENTFIPTTGLIVDSLMAATESAIGTPMSTTEATGDTLARSTEIVIGTPISTIELTGGILTPIIELAASTVMITAETSEDTLVPVKTSVVDAPTPTTELTIDTSVTTTKLDSSVSTTQLIVDTPMLATELAASPSTSTIELSTKVDTLKAGITLNVEERSKDESRVNIPSKLILNENHLEPSPTDELGLSDSGYLESPLNIVKIEENFEEIKESLESNVCLASTKSELTMEASQPASLQAIPPATSETGHSSTDTTEAPQPATPPTTPPPRRPHLSNNSSKHSILSLTSDVYTRLKGSKSLDLLHTPPSEASSSSEKKKKRIMNSIKRPVRNLTRSATELFHLSPKKRTITNSQTISTIELPLSPNDSDNLSPTKQKKGIFSSTKKFFRKRTTSMEL